MNQNRYCLGVGRYAGLGVFIEICRIELMSKFENAKNNKNNEYKFKNLIRQSVGLARGA
jgi:hypothetical protein